MMVLAPDPVVGLVPLMLFSTIWPCSSQPNLFCAAVGFAPHLAEWNFCEIHFATEYGTSALGLFLKSGSVPSFCCTELLTQLPGPATSRPIALRKDVRRPEPVCGRNGWMADVPLPPTWFQEVMVQ